MGNENSSDISNLSFEEFKSLINPDQYFNVCKSDDTDCKIFYQNRILTNLQTLKNVLLSTEKTAVSDMMKLQEDGIIIDLNKKSDVVKQLSAIIIVNILLQNNLDDSTINKNLFEQAREVAKIYIAEMMKAK